jgi:hypothetical protein
MFAFKDECSYNLVRCFCAFDPQNMSLFEFASELGLSKQDFQLLLFAPFCGFLGGVVDTFLIDCGFSAFPRRAPRVGGSLQRARMAWLLARLTLGLIAGFMAVFPFVGTLGAEPSGAAFRAYGVAFGAGIAAPAFLQRIRCRALHSKDEDK